MDVINKLYSSVSNTVSQLSGVLPGNPVTREFEATQYIASAGPGLLWKIYKGYKKSTRQEASIFVLEKRALERWTKGDRDIMLNILRHGVTQLTKLRHPQILTVQHGLEESRESLAFAAEPVFASLANILGKTENMPQPIPSYLVNYKLYDLEIKYGLLQITEGLTFLHNDVKQLHRNLCPESIVVNQQGAWKIFGFDFCLLNENTSGPEPFWTFTEYCPAMHPLTQPSLDYLAPEYVLSASHSAASDIYSLGMLIYTLHSTSHQTLGNIENDYGKFKRFANELRQLSTTKILCINEGLRDYVKLMVNTTPELRPDPHQFVKIPYFEDVGVKTLNYLDSLFQWDNLQKSQFYKGLPQIIQKMPHRICIYRMLPCLSKEFVNPPMVPFVLPNVLLIAENSSKEEFIKFILPVLKPVMVIQDPIQILLIFMQKMELLLKLTPPEEIKTDILPMLYRALESDAQQIQELCLSVLPTFASLIDFPAMKNALLPRIKKLCLSTNYISVRVNCLLCLGKLLEHLDKWLVLDEVIPFLPQIPSREPAVLMGILGEFAQNIWQSMQHPKGIYKLSMTHKKLGITKEIIATKILPFLIPLCIENGLTLNQFNALIALVKQMISKVETEHRAKLEQLNSIQSDSKTFEESLSNTSETTISRSNTSGQSDFDKMFSSLGLDAVSSNSNNISTNSHVSSKPVPSMNGNSSTSLSIEEKQRIAKQQESAQRLSKQTALSPTPSANQQSRPSKPVDPTDQLLQSNMKQISQMPSTTTFRTNMANNVTQPQYNNWSNKPALPASTSSWDMNNKPSVHGTSSYSMTSNGQQNQMWQAQNMILNRPGMTADWSAFESLLPTNQPNKTTGSSQINSPLLSTSGSSDSLSGKNIKKLSNNELMDFLG